MTLIYILNYSINILYFLNRHIFNKSKQEARIEAPRPLSMYLYIIKIKKLLQADIIYLDYTIRLLFHFLISKAMWQWYFLD